MRTLLFALLALSATFVFSPIFAVSTIEYIQLKTTTVNHMNISKVGTNEYSITTTGGDPYVASESFTQLLPSDSTVLTFEYISSAMVSGMEFFFGPAFTAEKSIRYGSLDRTTSWKTFSCDLRRGREEWEWGRKGDNLRFDFGEKSGIAIRIRNIRFRGENAEERKAYEAEAASKRYIDNGRVRLGVDMLRGGSIFYFALSSNQNNLLNHADEGRFIQQSYYGEADGSKWSGNNWVWNPIQGGGCNGTRAPIKDFRITEDTIWVLSTPVHWAYSTLMPELEMEETIALVGDVAHIHYTFRNNGATATNHPANTHELPAVFVDFNYQNFVYYNGNSPWTNGELTSCVPGWPNEYHKRTEDWSAYVNASNYGIGVYTPGTFELTAYRFGSGGGGPKSGNCSYFAPIRNFAITKNMVFEYDVYLTIGDLKDIRKTFYDLHNKNYYPLCIKHTYTPNSSLSHYYSLNGFPLSEEPSRGTYIKDGRKYYK